MASRGAAVRYLRGWKTSRSLQYKVQSTVCTRSLAQGPAVGRHGTAVNQTHHTRRRLHIAAPHASDHPRLGRGGAAMGLLFTGLVYLSGYLFLIFVAICLACGLYYLAELAEEYTSLTRTCPPCAARR